MTKVKNVLIVLNNNRISNLSEQDEQIYQMHGKPIKHLTQNGPTYMAELLEVFDSYGDLMIDLGMLYCNGFIDFEIE